MRIGTQAAPRSAPHTFVVWPALLALALQLPALALMTLRAPSLERALAAYLPPGAGRASAAELGLRVEIALEVREAAGGARELAVAVGARKFQIDGDRGIDGVAERLRELRDDDPQLAATLTAGPGVRCDDVERVLGCVASAGFSDIAFGSAHPRAGARTTR